MAFISDTSSVGNNLNFTFSSVIFGPRDLDLGSLLTSIYLALNKNVSKSTSEINPSLSISMQLE